MKEKEIVSFPFVSDNAWINPLLLSIFHEEERGEKGTQRF